MRYTVIIERAARENLEKIRSPFFEAIDKKY